MDQRMVRALLVPAVTSIAFWLMAALHALVGGGPPLSVVEQVLVMVIQFGGAVSLLLYARSSGAVRWPAWGYLAYSVVYAALGSIVAAHAGVLVGDMSVWYGNIQTLDMYAVLMAPGAALVCGVLTLAGATPDQRRATLAARTVTRTKSAQL